jgi:putative intracellular protease/amidase
LLHSVEIGSLRAEDFDFVLLLGGHGAMWDFIDNLPLKHLLEHFNRKHQWMGAVGNGVAGFLSVANRMGQPLVKDRQLTARSNAEEQVSGSTQLIPFLLESKLIALGAAYTKGPDFLSHLIIDGTLITGQNSASAKAVAKALLSAVKDSPKHIVALDLPGNN